MVESYINIWVDSYVVGKNNFFFISIKNSDTCTWVYYIELFFIILNENVHMLLFSIYSLNVINLFGVRLSVW